VLTSMKRLAVSRFHEEPKMIVDGLNSRANSSVGAARESRVSQSSRYRGVGPQADGIRTDRIWLDTRLRATYGARASSHRVTVRLAETLEASRFGFFEQSTVLRKQSAGKTWPIEQLAWHLIQTAHWRGDSHRVGKNSRAVVQKL
jgi:hypothetical protein